MDEALKSVALIIAVHVVGWVVVVSVIRKLLFSDTMRAVRRIGQAEAEIRKREDTIRQEIEAHEKEFARKKAEAEEEVQQRREASEKDILRMRDKMLDDSKKDAAKILEQAKKSEEKVKSQYALEMEEKMVDYAGDLFKLVFSERIGQELNRQFIDELLDALEEIDGASITVEGGDAEFIASHPILPEQKRRLEEMLASKFGVTLKVEEKLQEDLLAGLVLKLGSLEIDGSLLNRYREAAAELKKVAH